MDDCISRKDAIVAVQKYGVGSFDFEYDYYTPEQAERFIINLLSKLPSVQSERKNGKWNVDEYGIYHCPFCCAINNTVYKNFCPECGADMRGEQDE